MARWFIVEALYSGKRTYCGRIQSTEEEIRAAFPSCWIVPLANDTSLVTVTKRP